MGSKDLPIIFSRGARREETFVFPSIFHLLPKAEFLHYHDILELGVCLKGTGRYVSNVETTPFCEGDVQVIPPFQPHYNLANGEGAIWTFLDIDLSRVASPNIHFDADYLHGLASRTAATGIFKESQHPTIVSLVRRIVDLSRNTPDSESLDLLVALVCTLLLELSLSESRKRTVPLNKQSKSILPAIQRASEALERGERIAPSEMASVCFMSESHFRRSFTSVMGESPKTYLLRLQTQKAAALLITTDLSISEITRQCGFEDNSTLYRRFTKAFGCSPSEYRQAPGSKEDRNQR